MKTATVKPRQTLHDIAVMYLGDGGRAVEIGILNGLTTFNPLPGTVLNLPAIDIYKVKVAAMFNNVSAPNSDATDILNAENLEGIEIWALEDDFVVS